MSTFTKPAHTTKWIAVKNLSIVWASAQRGFDDKHADRIASEFDPDLFDDLVVTLPNGDGVYHVVDGQHRKAAIQQIYGDDETVPCRIVDAADPARAADIFSKINRRRKPLTSIERFLVGVTAGYETEVAVNKIVTFLGYRIAGGHGHGIIQAVEAVVSVYKNYGGEVLKNTLMTIKATWGDDNNAVAAPIIRGYGAFIAEYGSHADPKFWTRLRETAGKSGSPGALIGRSRTLKESFGISMAEAVKRQLAITYNTGLRRGKLRDAA